MRLTIPCLAAALVPLPALADCPRSPQDVAQGVYFSQDRGADGVTVMRMTARPDGTLLQETVEPGNRPPARFVWTTPVLLAEATVLDAEGRPTSPDGRPGIVYAYPEGTRALPQPVPGATFAETIRIVQGARSLDDVAALVSVGQPEPRDWGGCRYTVLPVTTAYRFDGGGFLFRFDYVTELGFSISVGDVRYQQAERRFDVLAISTGPLP